jgi:hypothetical protein
MQTTGSGKAERHEVAALERPKFRQDLVAEQVDEAGHRFIDVADPETGNLFRFYEVEYSLACAMDGERDVPGIVRWAQEELGLKASPSEVKSVIQTLGSLGFIDSGAAGAGVSQTDATAVAARAYDDELAPGIVVGKRDDSDVTSGSVELGLTDMAASSKHEELPSAPDYGLGAPGSSQRPKLPALPVEDISLGASGASTLATTSEDMPPTGDMSLDFAIKPDDVKEAVRASRVMNTPELPPELLEAEAARAKVEAKVEAKAPVKPEPKKPEPVIEAKKPEAKKPEPEPMKKAPQTAPMAKVAEPKPVEAKPASPRIEKAKPAVELPKAPVVEKKPPHPVAPRSGVSGMTIVLFVLLVLTAAGFFAWKYLLNNDEPEAQDDDATLHHRRPPKLPPKPAEPPPIGGKVVLERPAATDLSSLTAGAVESVETNDKMVKADDVVIRLVGAKALETDLAAMQKDIDRVKGELDKATGELAAAKDDAAKAKAQATVTDRQKSLDDKQAKMTAKAAELAKFVIKAPVDGRLSTAAKVGQKVAATEAIAKLAPMPVLAVVLKDPSLTVGSAVTLAIKDNEKRLACTVASVEGDSAKVTCPAEPAVENGTDVTLVK